MTILVSILLVSAWLLGIHNFAYIYAAKILGFTVSHFSIGSGWTVYEFTLGTTTFRLGALPTGGRVTVERPEVSFRRLLLTCSGPIAIFLLAFFLAWLHMLVGIQRVVPRGAVVLESPAAVSDLQRGDLIIEAAGQPIQSGLDLSQALARWTSGELVLTIETSTQVRQAKLARLPGANDKMQPLGFVFSSFTETKRHGPIEALKKTPEAMIKLILAVLVGEGSLVALNAFYTAPTISASLDAIIVIALGMVILNLIPIPPLVGGDALAMAIELIRRRRRRANMARSKGIVGVFGVVIAGSLIGFSICMIPSTFFLAIWSLLMGLFFLDNAAGVTRAAFGRRLIVVLTLVLAVGIPLIYFTSRIAGFSLPVQNAERVGQIVRWTELNRYWLK
jgi:membrane-associated protease RseP (regulator of RpoE activity)